MTTHTPTTQEVIATIQQAKSDGQSVAILHQPGHGAGTLVRAAALSILGDDSAAFEAIDLLDQPEDTSDLAWVKQRLERLHTLLDQNPNKVGIAYLNEVNPRTIQKLVDGGIVAHERVTYVYGLTEASSAYWITP